jgi:hypothetical protein
MVDDGTRRNELAPDDDVDRTDDLHEPRTTVRLNPYGEQISGQRLVGIAAVLGGAVAVGFGIYAFITLYGMNGPSEGLEGVVLLCAAFVSVALLLYLGTLVHRALGMGAPAEALGMPEGSIRALIAMSLILIFAIIGILVFTAGSAEGTETTSTGVTQEQIQALRADGALVLSQTLLSPAPPSPAAPLYTVTTRQTMTRESHDFGLQLMTTVSTLVVAVAGFYFGSRAVSAANTAMQDQLRLTRTFSARRPEVIGPRVDPDAAADEDLPGDELEDEIGPVAEGEDETIVRPDVEVKDDLAVKDDELDTHIEPEGTTPADELPPETDDEPAVGDELDGEPPKEPDRP